MLFFVNVIEFFVLYCCVINYKIMIDLVIIVIIFCEFKKLESSFCSVVFCMWLVEMDKFYFN